MKDRDPSELEIGDEIELVVKEPNRNHTGDALAQYGGIAVFVSFPADYVPQMGEHVKAKVADRSHEPKSFMTAVAIDIDP